MIQMGIGLPHSWMPHSRGGGDIALDETDRRSITMEIFHEWQMGMNIMMRNKLNERNRLRGFN